MGGLGKTLCGLCGHNENDHLQPVGEGDSWGPFYCEVCDCVIDDDPERRARILASRLPANS